MTAKKWLNILLFLFFFILGFELLPKISRELLISLKKKTAKKVSFHLRIQNINFVNIAIFVNICEYSKFFFEYMVNIFLILRIILWIICKYYEYFEKRWKCRDCLINFKMHRILRIFANTENISNIATIDKVLEAMQYAIYKVLKYCEYCKKYLILRTLRIFS